MQSPRTARSTPAASTGGTPDRRRGLWRLVLAAAALLCLVWNGTCAAQSDAAEYRIKAAYLYKFAGYIEWPAQAFAQGDSPIVIGVAGADALADELAQIVGGRSVNGRPLMVKKLTRQDALKGLHMLFIGRGEAHAADMLAAARSLPLLTVTELDEDRKGAAASINFVLVDDKVRFDVDLEPAEQAGIKISSRLLTVARKVSSKPS